MKIAVIITAYNRKEKTLSCLRRLRESRIPEVDFTVFLTDDGSTDGTSEAVMAEFPDVVISKGNGNLYYSRGTNLSWKKAIETGGFDGYLLHNDDTSILPHLWQEIIEADKWCVRKYGQNGIYAGATVSLDGEHTTYGALRNTSRLRLKCVLCEPDGTFQKCDLANGNILYVSKNVVDKLGVFYEGFVHGGGEYDYTRMAIKAGVPILLMRTIVGKCDNDHKMHREVLMNKNLRNRIKYLYSPIGMDLKDNLTFLRRNCIQNYPVRFVAYWAKAIFPRLLNQ